MLRVCCHIDLENQFKVSKTSCKEKISFLSVKYIINPCSLVLLSFFFTSLFYKQFSAENPISGCHITIIFDLGTLMKSILFLAKQ